VKLSATKVRTLFYTAMTGFTEQLRPDHWAYSFHTASTWRLCSGQHHDFQSAANSWTSQATKSSDDDPWLCGGTCAPQHCL